MSAPTRRARAASPAGPEAAALLDFCNRPLSQENWRGRCVEVLQAAGALPPALGRAETEGIVSRFTWKGHRATFGNVTFVRDRFAAMFAEIAAAGKFPPQQTQLVNAALAPSRGLRFQLDRRIPARRDQPETLFLRPQTFDLDTLLHFVAARFLSGLDPKRLRRCPGCGALFLLSGGRHKRFCRDGCRLAHHNRQRVASGRQARYMRERREKQRGRARDFT